MESKKTEEILEEFMKKELEMDKLIKEHIQFIEDKEEEIFSQYGRGDLFLDELTEEDRKAIEILEKAKEFWRGNSKDKKGCYWIVALREGELLDAVPVGRTLDEARKLAKKTIEDSGNTKYDFIDEVVILKEIETITENDIE
jgi:hypothetical protein